MSNDNKSLKWRFDINTFRLIGRELITDRITAVLELVKNCYDANATEVSIDLKNVSKADCQSKIVIKDNGIGMSFEDVRDKWMVVGTNSKRSQTASPEPFRRRYVGEKGIGRFAVDKLGGRVIIRTKREGDPKLLKIHINWDEYEELANGKQLLFFTDISNEYVEEKAPVSDHGTTLVIESIKEPWSELDVRRLEHELEGMVSPYYPLNPPFGIRLRSNEYKDYRDKEIRADDQKYASHTFEIGCSGEAGEQEILEFDKESGAMRVVNVPVKSFGPVSLKLFYFNEKAKKSYNRAYKNNDARIDGVKIYRDGLIATPFVEFEENRDKKRDILGIDKRLWSGAFDKVGTREVIGVLSISRDRNPKIIDATNRQDFVDNKEYRELKQFVISQLDQLSGLKKYEREAGKEQMDSELQKANDDVKAFASALVGLERENPKLREIIAPLKKQARSIDTSIRRGIKQQNRERAEFLRKESLYLSLMSLQEYAIHVSHAVRTALGNVKRMAGFFKKHYPNPKYENYFVKYSGAMYAELNNLSRAVDFMLSYAGSSADVQDFNVKELLNGLFNDTYGDIFKAEAIDPIVEIRDNFELKANRKFFEDIFENLISNSIKALKGRDEKIIKCTGVIERDVFSIYFSDNGVGVPLGDEERIFEMYYTTTANVGGAGLGLYIVRTRVESLGGKVFVADPEFTPGVTFRIDFPFNSK